MEISKVLEPLGIPVTHPPYSGSAETFVTYQLVGQVGVLYAEGQEKETGVMYSVDFYTEKTPFTSDILEIKRLLSAAGWNSTINAEIYEKETGKHHIAMSATHAGAIYG